MNVLKSIDKKYWMYIGLIGVWYSTVAFHYSFYLPLAPFLIAWELSPKKMDLWNRVGVCLGIAFFVSGLGFMFRIVVDDYVGNLAKHFWMIIPMGLQIIGLSLIWKKDLQPWFKLIVICIVMTIVFSGVETGIINATYGDFSKSMSNYLSKPRFVNREFETSLIFMRLSIPFLLTIPTYGAMLFMANWKRK